MRQQGAKSNRGKSPDTVRSTENGVTTNADARNSRKPHHIKGTLMTALTNTWWGENLKQVSVGRANARIKPI